MYRRAVFIIIFLSFVGVLIASISVSPENQSAENLTVEEFKPEYATVNATGYHIYIEENVSSVPLFSKVLYLSKEAERYNRLDGIMGQFGDPNLDGGPREDWAHSLNWRTRNAIEKFDYIKYRNRYYDLSFEGPEELSDRELLFDARLMDDKITPGDPAEMQLKLNIESDSNITISTGAPYPFKTLYASSENGRICIWSEEYAKSDYVSSYCEGGGVKHISFRKTHNSGEVIQRNYSIRSQDVNETGSYVIEEDLEYYNGSMEKTLKYRIDFELESY